MTIIFGAGSMGKQIYERLAAESDEILFYDNDRRKWGKFFEGGTRIITLEEYLDLCGRVDTRVILGSSYRSAPYFLRDTCVNPDSVYGYDEGKLVPLNLSNLQEWNIDYRSLEEEKLKKYKMLAEKYKTLGNETAYNHAITFIRFKEDHLTTPELGGIELTNHCNLKCPNCPNPTINREKGYMSEETFQKALSFIPPGTQMSFHGLGEPLLHSHCLEWMEIAQRAGMDEAISTNGLLLDRETAEKIFAILKKTENSIVYISFHTKRSVECWKECLKVAVRYPHVAFYGQVLEHNEEQAYQWLYECGISDVEQNPFLRKITSHSFAGNVTGRKTRYRDAEIRNRIRACTSLRNNHAQVRWDGRLSTCCYDAECITECGNINDFENAENRSGGYPLCTTCDPDWMTGFH